MSAARQAGSSSGRRAGSTSGRAGGAGTGSGAASGGVAPRPRSPEAAPDEPAATGGAVATAEPDTAATEATAAEAPEQVESTEERAARPARRGAPWWLVAVTTALAVLAVVGLLVVLLGRPSEKDLRDSALLAGRSYVADVTTYDARTLDADVKKVEKVSSPSFAKEYDANIAKVRDTVVKAQTVATGTVVGAGVEKLSSNQATVLVAVNQQFQAPGQQARTEAARVRVQLVRRNGNWYLDKVERL